MILHFSSKHCRSRWENLDRGQYPFRPIKFVNLVVPRPCETGPYNNRVYCGSFWLVLLVLWVVLGGFGSFWVVPCFSNYGTTIYAQMNQE